MWRNRVDHDLVSMKGLRQYLSGEEDRNDSHDTDRFGNHTKSFNSAYRKKNVGNRWGRFYLWPLWICDPGGFRSFDG
jgi:hypothetical protein